MLQKHSDRIMAQLGPNDKVLDIGGWAHPFNRADWVMDLGSYETRGYYNKTFARANPIAPLGGSIERFTKETWIQRDICARQPYPFRDKELDYVICSHTLEDIRDPVWVCSEMVRIAKAGYVEIPSRLWETCRGHEPAIAGLSHHRWLIEIEGNHIRFLQKLHLIHRRRYSLPKQVLKSLTAEESVTWLFWKDSFSSEEEVLIGDEQQENLTNYVARYHTYPKWLIAAEDFIALSLTRVGNMGRRFLRLSRA